MVGQGAPMRAHIRGATTMIIHPAFLGHGIFTEFPAALLARYNGWDPNAMAAKPGNAPAAGSPGLDGFIRALKYMNIPNVWVYTFSRSGMIEPATTAPLIDALKKQQFNLAAWGYCSTQNAPAVSGYAKKIKET